jgi:hypothetical protein
VARFVHRSNFLFRRVVRVRPARFHQWRSEGVCTRENIRGKANRNDAETEKESLIESNEWPRGFCGANCRELPASGVAELRRRFIMGRSWQVFLSAEEQGILLHSRFAKPAWQGALRENWCLE